MSRLVTSASMRPSLRVALGAAALCVAPLGCNRLTTPPEPEPMTNGESPKPVEAPKPSATAAPAPTASGGPEAPLGVVDVAVGKGPEAKAGDKVKVHYTGTLTNGTEFDSSRKGQVIKGWDQGVAGMKVGGKRKLTIPPSLGYGARGAGGTIPPNATLLFDVELVEIEK
jgi:hypothetical protein